MPQTEPKYLGLTEQQEAVRTAIAEFPTTFGMRAFPNDTFCLSEAASYYSPSEGVLLYTMIRQIGGKWGAFAKGTAQELRRAIVPAPKA